MKAEALSVRECAWMSEECRLLDQQRSDSRSDSVCLPNIFRSKKVRPLAKAPPGPSYQVYHTARELLLQVLDREAVRLLVRRAAAARSPQTKEQSADLPQSEYSEALMWFSVVLQKGVTAVGSGQPLDSQLGLRMDGWRAVLKRNSFQGCLCSLSRLDGGDQLEALWAFCRHLTARFLDLYTPGRRLAVKKYRLSCQQETCSLHLALLCDLASGFICNMYLYCPERLRRQSRRPVVGQVVEQLLRPFCRNRHLVQLDGSAWAQGRLADVLSSLGLNIDLVPCGEIPIEDQQQRHHQQQQKQQQHHHHQQQQHLLPLQGWTGPALFPPADLKGSAADVFLPGLWVALHITYINTFTLHCLQNAGTGRRPRLTEFTRALASRLAAESSMAVPPLAHLSSASHTEAGWSDFSKQRWQAGDRSQRLLQPPGMLGVCGLDNSGNSCYLNAVLQCLCSTVPLVEHLLHHDTRRELAKSDCRVVEAFVRLLEEMWTGRSSSCAPVEATAVLFSILPQFNDQSQHDAQELLLFLLNALHDDLQKAAEQQQTLPPTRQWRCKRTCGWATGGATVVSRLFEGQLSYVMVCLHCEHQAHSTQAFTILSLPIPRDARSCSIQDCLSLFFRRTVLSGGEQVLCSECRLRRETLVLTALDQAPDIVVLHLKRFGCKGKNQVKLRTNVMFSTELDLSPFLSSSALNTPCSSYHLYAVVNHAGNLNMGHYTALCHNTVTQTWHYFDDSVVREVKDGPVQTPNAYMLLYSRRPLHKPKILGL